MTPQVETTQVGDRAVHNVKLALLKEAIKGTLGARPSCPGQTTRPPRARRGGPTRARRGTKHF